RHHDGRNGVDDVRPHRRHLRPLLRQLGVRLDLPRPSDRRRPRVVAGRSAVRIDRRVRRRIHGRLRPAHGSGDRGAQDRQGRAPDLARGDSAGKLSGAEPAADDFRPSYAWSSVDTLVLKLVLTPTLIGTASLAGRRWGPAVSGWLVGFPFTSAPVALFLALNEGVAFAATAAAGTMAGTISQAVFSVAYGWLARRGGWPLCLAGGWGAVALSPPPPLRFSGPLRPLSLVLRVSLAAALRLMPVPDTRRRASSTAVPRWDIAARMVVATTFVLLLTGIASALGPELTGLLSPFPLYAGILAAFGHHFHGPQAAIAVLRG